MTHAGAVIIPFVLAPANPSGVAIELFLVFCRLSVRLDIVFMLARVGTGLASPPLAHRGLLFARPGIVPGLAREYAVDDIMPSVT